MKRFLAALRDLLRSIRGRLIGSYLLLTVITVTFMSVMTLNLIRNYSQNRERQYLMTYARAVAEQALPLMSPTPQPERLAALARSVAETANVRVSILDAGGDLLAEAEPPPREYVVWAVVPSEEGEPEVQEIVVGPEGTEFPGEGAALVDVYPPASVPRSAQRVSFPIGSQQSPVGQVMVSEGPDLVTGALDTTREALAVAATGAAVVALILGLLTGHRLAAPLENLTEATARISGGDLAVRAPEYGAGEVGQLARQFNAMAGRLEESFAALASERDALRRFIADASHELRTPITALRTFNELLQGPAVDDAAAREEFLEESQAQIERLTWITHNLLDLSRLDAGLAALELEDCDAAALLERVAAPFRPQAGERGLTLVVATPAPGLTLRCDRARVEMALANLVDNAVKYTPPEGEVILGAERKGPEVRLWVRDTGPGVGAEELPRLFNRFYRAGARSVEGSGLGLSIARRIAEAHGGRAAVESAPGAGSTFVLAFPAAGKGNAPRND